MNDRATFETAHRLKAAGFPQPKPAPGQVWISQKYNTNIDEYGIIIAGKITFESGEWNNLSVVKKGIYTYAPTATDILRELGLEYDLCYDDFHEMWICYSNCHRLRVTQTLNPAEACAIAWIAQNEG